MGFQIVFDILKIKNAQCIFAYNLRTKFCRHKVFGRIIKPTMVHHLTAKKTHIDGPIFFKIHISDLFQSTFGQAWLDLTTLSRDIGDLLFQSTMGMQGMPYHTQEKLRDQTVASWMSYYIQKSNFLPKTVFEIL